MKSGEKRGQQQFHRGTSVGFWFIVKRGVVAERGSDILELESQILHALYRAQISNTDGRINHRRIKTLPCLGSSFAQPRQVHTPTIFVTGSAVLLLEPSGFIPLLRCFSRPDVL